MVVAAPISEQRVVLDEWEAGELSVEYDDHEPQEVIAWALDTFARDRVAICTSFQTDGMAILDMAWRIRPDVPTSTTTCSATVGLRDSARSSPPATATARI